MDRSTNDSGFNPRQQQNVKNWMIHSRSHSSLQSSRLLSSSSSTTTTTTSTLKDDDNSHDQQQQEEPQQEPQPTQQSQSQSSYYERYDATLTDQTFHELYQDVIPTWLLDSCRKCGYVYPTIIQRKALDTFFFGGSDSSYERDDTDNDDDDGPIENTHNYNIQDQDDNNDDEDRDEHHGREREPPNSMVIQAQTGSGKTLTYLLPILSRIDGNRSSVQAMIVVPTRELGLQVAAVAKQLLSGSAGTGGGGKKFLVMNLLQGSQLKRQRAWAWAQTPQVVIGTPPELLKMVQYGGLPRVSSIKTVVVDEVDACLVHTSGQSIIQQQQSSKSGGSSSSSISSSSKTLSSSLHELLSKYLSPTFINDDDYDGSDAYDGIDIVVSTGGGGDRKRTSQQQPYYKTRRRTLFASATIPQHRHFIKQCKSNAWTIEEPTFVSVNGGEALPPTLDHGYIVCESNESQKVATLRKLIQKLRLKNNNNNNSNSSNGITTTTTTTSTKKILVFMDPSRPLDDIAHVISNDLSLLDDKRTDHQDEKDPQEETTGGTMTSSTSTTTSYVSILRMDDSLSQRAEATRLFEEGDSSSSTTSNGRNKNSNAPWRKYNDHDDDDDDSSTSTRTNNSNDINTTTDTGGTVIDGGNGNGNGGGGGGLRVMLTTDLAARGLDLDGISHVIHYDLPKDADTYLHRSGRAGRFGRKGTVLSILTKEQEFVLQRLANALCIDIPCVGRRIRKRKKKKGMS